MSVHRVIQDSSSEDYWAHPFGLVLNLEWCLCFEHIVQSHCNTCSLVSVPNHKPCHITLKYSCPTTNKEHMRPTYSKWRVSSHDAKFPKSNVCDKTLGCEYGLVVVIAAS